VAGTPHLDVEGIALVAATFADEVQTDFLAHESDHEFEVHEIPSVPAGDPGHSAELVDLRLFASAVDQPKHGPKPD
jgi:hypothetical protein